MTNHAGSGPVVPVLAFALVAACLLLSVPAAEGKLVYARRLAELHGCQPSTVPKAERCTYVREHPTCRPEDGWIPYLEIHYCFLDQIEAASTALFLLWIAVLFAVMLVVAERFFCPSLELISEHLHLPPCVAGATLLSFGNGAPDVFTQLAAISQGDSEGSSPDAIAMALSEPLGSGLFVGNIVFALVVFFSGLREVPVERSYFLKDCLFYLGGVVAVLGFLLQGVVMVWEVVLLGVYYVLFILVTILLSRGDEPVRADPRLHEVPHRLRPADSFLRESFRRLTVLDPGAGGSDGGLADADLAAPLLPHSQRSRKSNPGLEPIGEADSPEGEPAEAIGVAAHGAAGLDPAAAAEGARGCEATSWLPVDLDPTLDPAQVRRQRQHAGGGVGPGPAPAVLSLADAQAGRNGGCLGDGGRLLTAVPYGADGGAGDANGDGGTGAPALASMVSYGGGGGGTRTLSGGGCSEDFMPSAFGGDLNRVLSGGSPVAVAGGGEGWALYGRGGLERGPSLRRQGSGRPPTRLEQFWRKLEKPGLTFLSLFIPRVSIDTTHARYRKVTAVLLPPLLPTLTGWTQGWLDRDQAPGGFWRRRWWQASTGVGLAVAVAALLLYPRKGHLHGYAAGVATVVVFCEAMFLLDASAGELVSAAVALGQIYGISPSLLGATLLAWGNSVSDLVSNITLSMDGLPSMAITACFASPMFVLLAGLVTSLTYATRHGSMALPRGLALRVLYGSSCVILLMWALVVPLVFRFRLDRRVGLLAVAVYLTYQALYIAAVVHDSRV